MSTFDRPNTYRVELTPMLRIHRVRDLLEWKLDVQIGFENRIVQGEATCPPFFVVKEKCRLTVAELDLRGLTRKAFGYAHTEQQDYPEERQPFVTVIQQEKQEWDSPATSQWFGLSRAATRHA